jgi:hypothetical protein
MAALLDEDRMRQEIDQPIDDALEEFVQGGELAYSHRAFHRAIGSFMHAILEKALPCPRVVPISQAHDEAVAVLEEGYLGTHANGFYGAVMDAADPSQAGIPLVLARLAESTKRRQRRTYVRCVAARHVDPGDWRTRCAMAELLLERCREWLPPEMQSCPPEQFADDVCDLLLIDLGTNAQVQRVAAPAPNASL